VHTPRTANTQQIALTPALLDAMTAIAVRACTAILSIAHADIAAERKADGSSVTRADRAAEDVVLGGLTRNFPGTAIVSEEQYAAVSMPVDADAFFLVDPLDGTREFIAGSDEYTVNIALIQDGDAVAGVVAAPAQGLLWRGGKRLGAQRLRLSYGRDIELGAPEAIRARRWPTSHPIAAVSRSHLDSDTVALLGRIGGVKQTACGSALKFCRLAEGAADLYPRLAPTCEWDIAAGDAVLAAAGGIVLRPDGTKLRYGENADGFGVPAFMAWGDPAAVRILAAG
jgi:3'(2'), 5'-bisphosphate nucleotidase